MRLTIFPRLMIGYFTIFLYDQFFSGKENFNKFLAEAASIADTSEKKDSLIKIKTYYRRYESLIEKEIELVRSNKPSPKRWYEQELEQATDRMLEELKRLETYSRQDIQTRMGMLGEAGGGCAQRA